MVRIRWCSVRCCIIFSAGFAFGGRSVWASVYLRAGVRTLRLRSGMHIKPVSSDHNLCFATQLNTAKIQADLSEALGVRDKKVG